MENVIKLTRFKCAQLVVMAMFAGSAPGFMIGLVIGLMGK